MSAEERQDVERIVLVLSGRVVTDSEKEVDTEVDTRVENCVAVGDETHDICLGGIEGKGKQAQQGREEGREKQW